MYALLKQFQKREGQCNVPPSHSLDGANLGKWVANQPHRKKTCKLDPEKENKRLGEIMPCNTPSFDDPSAIDPCASSPWKVDASITVLKSIATSSSVKFTF
jgi:hypothetical protein